MMKFTQIYHISHHIISYHIILYHIIYPDFPMVYTEKSHQPPGHDDPIALRGAPRRSVLRRHGPRGTAAGAIGAVLHGVPRWIGQDGSIMAMDSWGY